MVAVRRTEHTWAVIERAGPNDLMQLAFAVGPVPMHIAAVVLMEPAEAFDLDAAVAEAGRRLARVPRLRQCREPPSRATRSE